MFKISTKKTEFLLFLAVIAVYGNTVMNGFAFDDLRIVGYNSVIRSWDNFFDLICSARGVRMFTYMLDYSLFGASPAGYHFHNLLWQVVALLLAYRLLQTLIKDERAAIISVFIFAVHPLHAEAVANISNRKEMICFVFFLSSLLSYINIFSAASLRKKLVLGGLSGLFFLLAFRSKEIAITIPFFFIIYELLFVQKNKRIILHRKFAYLKLALFIVVLVLSVSKFSEYILLDRHRYYFHYRLSGELLEYTHIIYNTFIVFVYYLRNFFFPVNLLPDYFIPAQGSLMNLAFALSFSCLVLYLYMVYMSYRKNRAVCFALLWLLVNYIVISPLNMAIYPLCDRYIYLPSLGAAMVTGIVLSSGLTVVSYKGNPAIWKALLVIAFLCLSSLSVSYNSYWKDNITLWRHALVKNPDSRIGHLNMATEYGKMGRFDKAENQLMKMGEIDPRDYLAKQVKMIQSEIHYLKHEKGRAFELYRAVVLEVDHANPQITYPYIKKFAVFFKASRLYVESLKAYNILKKAGYRLDEVSQEIAKLNKIIEYENLDQIERFKKSILLAPKDIRPKVNLGIIYYSALSYDKAEQVLNEALKINNNSFEAHYNLGLVYVKKEDFEEAAFEFEKAALLRPRIPAALHDNLGLVYLKLGRDDGAIEQFISAIRVERDFALAYLHLGNAYLRVDNKLKAIDNYKAFLKYWDGEEYHRKLVESQLSELF